MKFLRRFEKIKVDKIKEFIQEFKIKNALVLDSLMGEYRNLKYILKNPDNLVCYGVNDEVFDFISSDIKGLKGYVDSYNVDNKDTYGYRTNALRAEVIGNYAVLEKQKSLLPEYKWTVNGIPFSYYKNGFNQSDMGHFNLNLEVKSSGLFSKRGFVVESKHGFSNELLIVRCSLKELSEYNITVFDDLDRLTEIYFVLGVLSASTQSKYITEETEGLSNHKSKKLIPQECYSNIVPLSNYDISESTTPIHLLNIVNNEQLRNQIAVILLETMGKVKIEGLNVLKDSSNKTLPTISRCKQNLKGRKNFNDLSVIDIKKIKILQNFQIVGQSDKIFFNLFYLTDKGIEYRKELCFDPNRENGEDFLHENGLSNCILVGSGIRSLIELIQKGCKNTNKEIEKTCLILDESDLSDIVDADYSMSIKSGFLKAIRADESYKKIDWFQTLLTLTLLRGDKGSSDPNCSFKNDMSVFINNLGTYYTDVSKRSNIEPELKKNLKIVRVLPLLYSIGYSIGLLCSKMLNAQFKPIINQRFPNIIVTKDSYYSYNRDLLVYSSNGIFPSLDIYVKPPFLINKEDLLGTDGVLFNEESLKGIDGVSDTLDGSDSSTDELVTFGDSLDNLDSPKSLTKEFVTFGDSSESSDSSTKELVTSGDSFSNLAAKEMDKFLSDNSINSAEKSEEYSEDKLNVLSSEDKLNETAILEDENTTPILDDENNSEKNNFADVPSEIDNLSEENKNNSEKIQSIFDVDIPRVLENESDKNNDPYLFGNSPNFDPYLLEIEKRKGLEINEPKSDENVEISKGKNTLKNTESKLKLLGEIVENVDGINRKNILIEQLKYFNLYYSYSGFISMSELYSKKSIDKEEFLGYLIEYLGNSDEEILLSVIDFIKKKVI